MAARSYTRKSEYKTTSESWCEAGQRTEIGGYVDEWEMDIPDPVQPAGAGWQMIGSAAAGRRLFWFWTRAVSRRKSRAKVT